MLLGSGASTASGIPTGWEILIDLIRKLAEVQGKSCGDAPDKWYEAEYGVSPNYSDLIKALSKTPAESGLLLRSYFEPTYEDREQGKKVPSPAHKAVAQLVARGYVRLIVTTNFDRLMEQALESAGIVPTIISSPDAIQGAIPLAHSRCTIVKVHGDYLDTRLKNTRDELETYDERTDRFLDRIFDEYGLIVCGWSAEWDTALRKAVARSPNRRFTTYWSCFAAMTQPALDLCTLRQAEVIHGHDADSFFGLLSDGVRSLANLAAEHPLTTPVAVATLKRYVAEARHRVRLEEFVLKEVETAKQRILSCMRGLDVDPQNTDRAPVLSHLEACSDRLLRLLIAGAYWGVAAQRRLWIGAIERVSRTMCEPPDSAPQNSLNLYPAMLMFYGCGLAAMLGGRNATLALLLTHNGFRSHHVLMPFPVFFYNTHLGSPIGAFAHGLSDSVGSSPSPRLWLSTRLAKVLREPLSSFLPTDDQFRMQFARFEYLLALAFLDWSHVNDTTRMPAISNWVPPGTFEKEPLAIRELKLEIQSKGAKWALLKAGLCDGLMHVLGQRIDQLDAIIQSARRNAESNAISTRTGMEAHT